MEIAKGSKRIFFILLGLISFIAVVFLYMGYFHHQFVLKTIVKEEQDIAHKIYVNTFKNISDKYESIARNILMNEQIVSAFEKGQRDKLLTLSAPIYKELSSKNKHLNIMHFHTADTKSFLRLHKPEKFGDDLSDIRHMINSVNKLKKKQIGAEIGRYGIHYRVALPVSSKSGKHLGVFEFGIDINYVFELFNKDYNFKSVLLLNKDIFSIIYENNKSLNKVSFTDKFFMIVQDEAKIYEHLPNSIITNEYSLVDFNGDDNLIFNVTDLMSISGENIGKIFFIKNLNFYTDKIGIIRNITIFSAIFLLLLSFYLLKKVFRNYTVEIESYQKKLEIKNRTLLKLSNIDYLTKINNRRSIETILGQEIKRVKRYSKPLSLIMLDVDNFKTLNDTYGHNVGDKILRNIAKSISLKIRNTDYAGRWGGEEFIIVLTETTIDNAVLIAEKIRETISQHKYESVGQVTCSLGVTEHKDAQSLDMFVHNADTALYEAKHSGKNKVIICKEC